MWGDVGRGGGWEVDRRSLLLCFHGSSGRRLVGGVGSGVGLPIVGFKSSIGVAAYDH